VVEGKAVGELNLGNEFEGIFGIAEILIDGGYLEDGFQIESISSDNLADFEQIFGFVGQSQLIGYMIPVATRFGFETFLPEELGINFYDRTASAKALEEFETINWDEEFDRLYVFLESILEFGSIGEIMNYADNPELLAELTPAQGEELANIFRTLGDLKTLTLLNVAIDYATTLEEVQEMISWMDPSEVEAYLGERLDFIFENENFFIGEEGEVYRIAQLIETIFSDEFGDVNLVSFFEGMNDPAALLEEQNEAWIGALIEDLINIQLIIEGIPLGVDFAIYTTFTEDAEAELAEDLADALENISWDEEIGNVSDIYKEVLKLGLASIMGEEPDYFAFLDDVIINNMDTVRTLVEKIFEESQVVNATLEIATPIIIDRFVEDQDLKDLLNDAMMSDPESEVIDFNFGQEVNNLLTLVESLYNFTTISELATLSDMNTEALFDLAANFGSMSQAHFTELTDAVESLQFVSKAGHSLLTYVKNLTDIEQLYVPTTVDLGKDLTSILGLVYTVGGYLADNIPVDGTYEDLDLAPLFADETFKSYLLDTPAENHSEILLINIAHLLQYYSEDEDLG
ncbi:MAG: hypothetical protein IH571_01830, partial [Acholeplasmataceae bacterium]|nr:hypothetical protein [Acholeplasmataceae bacterium]